MCDRLPVLFVHGAPGDARVWAPVVGELAGTFDARTITLSYFGPEPWAGDGSDFGTRRHAADVIAAIEDMASASPVHLVAWSFGCHPALLALLERPDLVASLFLYEPSLATYVDDADALATFVADCAEAFPLVAKAMAAGNAEHALDLILANAGAGDLPPDRRAMYRDSLRALPLLMGGGEPPAEITAQDLGRIACPVNVAMGADTRAMFAIPSRAVAAGVPDAVLEIVADAGHMLPETRPACFAALVASWLQRREQD